jgi:hypothetical protein
MVDAGWCKCGCCHVISFVRWGQELRRAQVPERERVVRSPLCASSGWCRLRYGFRLAGRDGCWPVGVAGADERKTGERAAITVVTEAELTDRERSPRVTRCRPPRSARPSGMPPRCRVASTLALRPGAAHRPAALTQRRQALRSARDPLARRRPGGDRQLGPDGVALARRGTQPEGKSELDILRASDG